MTNAEAVEATIQALRDLGRINPIDEALIALARTNASALDAYPMRATLLKEHRDTLTALLAVGANKEDDDGLDKLQAALSAALSDSKE